MFGKKKKKLQVMDALVAKELSQVEAELGRVVEERLSRMFPDLQFQYQYGSMRVVYDRT